MYSKQDPSADWDAYCADRERREARDTRYVCTYCHGRGYYANALDTLMDCDCTKGVCPKCNKVRRVCEVDGCDSDEKVVEDATIVRTVAKNAIVDERGFVKIEPLDNKDDIITWTTWSMQVKINELVDAVNELREQSK